MPPLLAHWYPVASGRPGALPVPAADCFDRFSGCAPKFAIDQEEKLAIELLGKRASAKGGKEGRPARVDRVVSGSGAGGGGGRGRWTSRPEARRARGEGLSCRASPPRDGGGSPVTQDLTGLRRCHHHLRRRRTWRRVPQFPKEEASLFRFVTSLSSPRRRGLGGARKCVQVPSAKAAANKFASLPS